MADWWVLPLIGLVFIGAMLLVCFRRFGCGCMGNRRRDPGEPSSPQRDVDRLKEDVRKMTHQAS